MTPNVLKPNRSKAFIMKDSQFKYKRELVNLPQFWDLGLGSSTDYYYYYYMLFIVTEI